MNPLRAPHEPSATAIWRWGRRRTSRLALPGRWPCFGCGSTAVGSSRTDSPLLPVHDVPVLPPPEPAFERAGEAREPSPVPAPASSPWLPSRRPGTGLSATRLGSRGRSCRRLAGPPAPVPVSDRAWTAPGDSIAPDCPARRGPPPSIARELEARTDIACWRSLGQDPTHRHRSAAPGASGRAARHARGTDPV